MMALGCSLVQQVCCKLGMAEAACDESKSCLSRSANMFGERETWRICGYPGAKLRHRVLGPPLCKPWNEFSVCGAVGGTATESPLTRASVEETPLTLYDILGVSQGVSESEVKEAYRSLAKKYHPDHAPFGKVEEHQKKFLEVHKAYSILKDPRRRALYDFEIRNSLPYQRNWRFHPRTGQWRGCNWETDQCWTC